MASTFFWYDLVTTDVAAAVEFYKAVAGWNSEAFGGNDYGYIVMKAGETGVGGIMPLPNPQQPPAWLGYIKARDTDAETKAAVAAGGTVWHEPDDIPGGVGRFSVIADPNGAAYMLLQPNGPDYPSAAPMTAGHVGWNEYMGDDWEKAFDYYSGLYGWTQSTSMDMGEMGTYQLFAVDGVDNGGMMTRPPFVPVSNWGFYFVVEGIDAAAERVTTNGGKVLMGPMEVPGGQWVINAQDPQGAYFGLVSNTK